MLQPVSRRQFLGALGASLALAPDLAPADTTDDACQLLAEVSTLAVERGAFLVCLSTGHPVACAIAAAAESVAARELFVQGLTLGCSWSVRKVDGLLLRIKVTAPPSREDEVRKTYQVLRKSPDLRFQKTPLP